jgi:radical SAM protein with 4Fe4S-binding SPASM domain
VSYGTFSQSLHRQVLADRTPLNGTIEVTRRCPLTCAHCYNNLAMGDRQAQLAELTTREHQRILDEMAEAGCLWLLYTGGEIFARRDFLDIYTHAKRDGFLITLYTNGILINERIADYLAEWRPFAIEITLYGRTRETYERLTGVPGSYDRCMRGISLVLERSLPLRLKTVAVTVNRHEVWEMQRFAEELGVEFRFDAMMNPRIDCSQSPLAVRLTPEECVAFDLEDSRRVAEWQKFGREFLRPVHPPETSDQLYHCGGGIDSFAINPYGEMSICTLSQQDRFDLRKGTFREGWEAFIRRVRDKKKITRLTKCVSCELKAMCGMCPANGELENGDAEAPVDFLCQTAHLRAHAFDLPVRPHGDCAYCAGGAGYERLMEAVGRLQTITPISTLMSTPTAGPGAAARRGVFLAMAPPQPEASSAGCGGCSSCGAHH